MMDNWCYNCVAVTCMARAPKTHCEVVKQSGNLSYNNRVLNMDVPMLPGGSPLKLGVEVSDSF